MGVREGERGYWTEHALDVEPLPGDFGVPVLCRCLTCCCKPNEGHRSRAYREWSAAMDKWEARRGRGSGAPAIPD
jgi:hypothetical protein